MDYQEKIQYEYSRLYSAYNKRIKKSNTGIKDVLWFLLDYPDRVWFWAWEFVGKTNSKGGYLSHRAPARASDLAIHHPEFVEHRKIGKYKVYRLKRENLDAIYNFLN